VTDLELFCETAGQVPRLTHWLVEARLAPKVKQNVERLCRAEDVQHVALMPDLHLGRLINNGVVVATTALIYPRHLPPVCGSWICATRKGARIFRTWNGRFNMRGTID